MFCSKCGIQYPDGAQFCARCGSKLEAKRATFCTQCGAQYPDGAQFCARCGSRIGGEAAQQKAAMEQTAAMEQAAAAEQKTVAAGPGEAAKPVAAVEQVEPSQAVQQTPSGGKLSGKTIGIVAAVAVVVIVLVVVVILNLFKPAASNSPQASSAQVTASSSSSTASSSAASAGATASLSAASASTASSSSAASSSSEEVDDSDEPKVVELGKKTAVGDIVELGEYEQDGDSSNGKEPIRWLVLKVEGGKAYLVSEKGLDSKQFHDNWKKKNGNQWNSCSLNGWLNGGFAGSTGLASNANVSEVTLLSADEAESLFDNSYDRSCEATTYAISQGAHVDSNNHCAWWLRTAGKADDISVAKVYENGDVDTWGTNAVVETIAVRPAIWVTL